MDFIKQKLQNVKKEKSLMDVLTTERAIKETREIF
jgi:hypothetical protein